MGARGGVPADALTLTSGQKFVVQTGLPMLAASDGGAVSVLASQDERVTISAEAGGPDERDFFAARPDSRARNARERRGRADADSRRTGRRRGAENARRAGVSDAAKGRAASARVT